MSDANRSTAQIDAFRTQLHDLADECGHRDAQQPLPPDAHSPTPGESAIATNARIHTEQLKHTQAAEAQQVTSRRPRLLATVWNLRPFEALLLGPLLAVETWALRGPIEVTLQLPTGNHEGWAIAAMLAVFAAVFAHLSAHENVASRELTGRARDIRHGIAVMWATGVALVATVAIGARIYASTAAGADDYTADLDMSGFGVFVGFQILFAAVNLGAAHTLTSRYHQVRTRAASERQERHNHLQGTHNRQLQELAAICTEALAHYRQVLAHRVGDLPFALAWQDRTARELEDGTLAHRLLPWLPTDDSTENGDGPTGDNAAPDGPDGPDSPDGPDGQPGGIPDPSSPDDDQDTSGSSPPDVPLPASTSPYDTDGDLIDAILDARPPS